MVTSIFTPSNRVCFTHPPNLSAELNALVDGYEITTREVFNPGHERAYVDSILRTIDKRQRALDWLLDRHPIDCGILVYNESDTVQHKLWPAEGFAGGDVPWPASGVVEVYRRLDLAVGRLVQRLGPDANFLVVSDHGAGPLRGVMCINLWLIQQGYLRLRRSAGYLLKWLLARTDLLVRTYGVLQRIGLGGLGRFVPNALRHSVATSFVSFDDVDWQRTRAYSHGEFGQIYLNLRGREPQGVVAPGQEADRLLGEIFDGLRRLVDPATGRPVVTQLWRRDELYRGPKAADGPDLVFVIDDYARDASVQFGLGRSQVLGEPEFVDRGCHRPEGIFIAAGPDIASGARPDQVSVMDVMPTALHLLGLPVPQDVDGRVLAEVLTGQAAARPLERSAAAACAAPAADAQPFSDDEQQQVKQRLRDLGYMD
jgi:predicted AlkP superfamily phosphohydrolase/phosphomutase